MIEGAPDTESSPWDEACLAALLLAVDPAGLGGIRLRAPAGPVRDGWLAILRSALPPGTPVVRIPASIGDERLLGGLDLTATLAAGRPVADRGLLAAADGGVAVLPMAERCPPGLGSRLATALDTGEVAVERDGFGMRLPARLAVVALDEGIGPDESPPAALTERLAMMLDLGSVSPREVVRESWNPTQDAGWLDLTHDREVEVAAARARLPHVVVPDEIVAALCAAALSFGIGSLRLPVLALRVAQASAALAGRETVAPDDTTLAARLVLAPRSTRLPAGQDEERAPDQPPADGSEPTSDPGEEPDRGEPGQTLEDVVREAVAAAIPAGLLSELREGGPARSGRNARSGAGAQTASRRRGRPAGTLRGEPKRGARLALVETLRAAAPWQPLRRRGDPTGRVVVRRDDLRITRFKRRSETTTLFVVDASGSAAFHRLAEAKGAVELLLAECYVRRDRVALIAFRGGGAELILPPTRSLTRAKRSLAALPGGGGTPLAAAIDAAGAVAASVARGGGEIVLVFMTDGRANIALDGRAGRDAAAADARSAARRLRTGPGVALLVDISPRPAEFAAAIAHEMGARYVPLPFADAATLSDVVRREAVAAGRAAR